MWERDVKIKQIRKDVLIVSKKKSYFKRTQRCESSAFSTVIDKFFPQPGPVQPQMKWLLPPADAFKMRSFTDSFFFFFLRPHPRHVEGPRRRSCQPTATPHPSHVFDLHHNSWQHWILSPLSKARDWTQILIDTSWVHYCWATTGTPGFTESKLLSVTSPHLTGIQN